MKKAFTMIELIFVIVIIGILAAIAIPKLAATRDDAEVSKIVANARVFHQDLQNYYTSKGSGGWQNDAVTEVTSMYLETSCGTAADSSTAISPTTFVFCHESVVCLSFSTVDDGNLTINEGPGGTDVICEAVKDVPAIMAITGKSYQLAGKTVER